MGVCNCSMFCCTLLYVHFSIAIILMGRRELVALLGLSSWCLVMVEGLFLALPRGRLWFVIVVFPDHTHLLFLYFTSSSGAFTSFICSQLLLYSLFPRFPPFFLFSGDFWCLLITFANSLFPDQNLQNVGPDLDILKKKSADNNESIKLTKHSKSYYILAY